jgi:hypothetical protein
MNAARLFRVLVAVVTLCACAAGAAAQGVLIPTDGGQKDFLKAYKFVLNQSTNDYRFTSSTLDTALFPRWGEYSVYWAQTGPNRGSFVYPDAMPSAYASVTSAKYAGYDWRAEQHAAISFKAYAKAVAVLRSDIRRNNNTVSWEAVYFRNLFESFLLPGISYTIGEREIDSIGLNWSTQCLIIPAFSVRGSDWKYYIDSMFAAAPRMKDNLLAFLGRGGTIYTEGNAVYVVERLGLLPEGAVNYALGAKADPATGALMLDVDASSSPLSFAQAAAGQEIYASTVPMVETGNAQVIARAQGSDIPVLFAMTGADGRNGRVICNTALPTVGGSNMVQEGDGDGGRQLQWALNAVLSAFTTSVDVTRSVRNEVPDTLTVGRNAAPFDVCDTLEIRVTVRNVSDADVTGVTVQESIRDFFTFVDVATPGVTASYTKPTLTLSGIDLPAHGERVITYRIATPAADDPIHEKVDTYISWASYIYASYGVVSYVDQDGATSYRKYRDYVDIMFSARLAADTDLNWKNFLGLYYQPFKVFMIMENKQRTAAKTTRYVQYIPKDVPFYWTDNTLNVPILKTPGGKYVDVLRGSNDQNAPEYDMDNDGRPDAWLDTASIFPKNYTLEETEVYWLNPWEHLRSGNAALYEDIDHDGVRAQDTNGDGVVDIEEPGDKIRVWKVTWDIGTVSGYQFFDPFCSYEIWVDPPDLVPMAAGVGRAYGRLTSDVAGMFYPYSPDLQTPDLTNTSWSNWMERDSKGAVVWKQLIYQKINNYEGFTFIDTAATGYKLKATDYCAGSVPQPHREFIAVLSLGGEEIDMNNYTPKRSDYSNLEYTTIFGERRTTPIRTTYTYYAPLPNPLQFEYITNNFTITDQATGAMLRKLPAYGKANLTFDIDASTEYSYYWIRNAGHDVDFRDPSLASEGREELGDGVFGYMVYDIPKGMGGYAITLPKKTDGSYDIAKMVKVDGAPYQPWLSNPNTRDSITVLEDQFEYHIWIPQILIPPALDDDNGDGIDDWIDDRGDRFQSSTGFLHDPFMLGIGEAFRAWPWKPFKDDIYGWVTSGWYPGADSTYGDDFFENLGKTHVTISAVYEGKGKEGSVDISKGGWLVVEEIFGGSPWVIFSHALSGYAEGVNYALTSSVAPTVARFGVDTVYIRHVIEDRNEPHAFDGNCDPWNVSFGYGTTTISTYAGGKDPCGLISPAVNFPAIIDPAFDRNEIVLIPNADTTNPDLKDYPKTLTGNFIEAHVEVSNGSDYNWVGTTITPVLPPELGATRLVMSYVCYPRPLVPAQVDPATGAVIRAGDDPTAFRTGWRFNQPEGEVLVKMGSTLGLMQPTRRAYFVFLFEVDPALPKGIYSIGFTLSGDLRAYNGALQDHIAHEVPDCRFSISRRDARGNVAEYQKWVIGQGSLTSLTTRAAQPIFQGLGDARWSARDVTYTNFDTLRTTLPAVYSPATGVETVDLSRFSRFPTVDTSRIYVLEAGQVTSVASFETLPVTTRETLAFQKETGLPSSASQSALTISTAGPKLSIYKVLASVNGRSAADSAVIRFRPGEEKNAVALVELTNLGSTIAENVVLAVTSAYPYEPVKDALPAGCSLADGGIEARLGGLLPGETRQLLLPFAGLDDACTAVYDTGTVISGILATYNGGYVVGGALRKDVFTVPDRETLELPAWDFQAERMTASCTEAARGQTVTLQAKCNNGFLAARNVPLRFAAIVNERDTIPLGAQEMPYFGSHAESVLAADFTVPDSAKCLSFIFDADPDNAFGEYCEYNNKVSVTVPIAGLGWILDVGNTPNPLRTETRFTYMLPRELRSLALTLYSLDGRVLRHMENLPVGIGTHAVPWRDDSVPAGVILYRFDGVDDHGNAQTYTSRLLKVK